MNKTDRITIFSGVLRVLMKDNKLTDKELAAKSGINQASIKTYTSGKGSPTVANLIDLAECLEVTPDQLLGFEKLYKEPEKPQDPPKKKKNNELAAEFARRLRDNGKTIADYKEIIGMLSENIKKNTKI